MPRYALSRVQDALNDAGKAIKGSSFLILGVAYKPDVDDLRESPALDIISLLEQKGGLVAYHDPHIPSFKHDGLGKESVPDLIAAVKAADCVVIITNHSSYDYPTILESAKIVVDTRNALGYVGKNNSKVTRL
jgi:UDP-N-acetyl-D-glucosamine dehydrogenase